MHSHSHIQYELDNNHGDHPQAGYWAFPDAPRSTFWPSQYEPTRGSIVVFYFPAAYHLLHLNLCPFFIWRGIVVTYLLLLFPFLFLNQQNYLEFIAKFLTFSLFFANQMDFWTKTLIFSTRFYELLSCLRYALDDCKSYAKEWYLDETIILCSGLFKHCCFFWVIV